MNGILASLIIILTTPAIPGASGLPPVHALTLGAVAETNIEAICAPGFARAHCVWRDKAAMLARYGIAEDQAALYEDDDLRSISAVTMPRR